MLCAHFLRTYAARYRSPVRELPRPLREAFLRWDWPGNVRELENAVRRYVILPDVEMALSYLASGAWDDGRRAAETGAAPPAAPTRTEPVPLPKARRADVSLRKVAAQAAEEAERELLRRALAETRWNRKEAAGLLQISYKALLNKLKKWEVDDPAGARRTDDAPAGSPRLSAAESIVLSTT
jgi:DNA-binding NtrC family response regulator